MLLRNPTKYSQVAEVGSLSRFDDATLLQEVPFFAAEGSTAYQQGGAVTRAFLNALPAEWQNDHLVVDSILVWLQEEQSLPTRWFHHEVYPGKTERAFAAANEERDVEHIACAIGAPCEREFLVGDLSFADEATLDFDLYRTATKDYPARHQFLREQRDAGHLEAITIKLNQMHRYAWGTFQRVMPTRSPGFHFWIRASLGSKRPIVNGMRNVASPSLTGPWQTDITL